MKIESYLIQAASNRTFYSEDIEVQTVKQTARVEAAPAARSAPVSLVLSDDAKQLLEKLRTDGGRDQTRAGSVSPCESSPENYALEIRQNLLEALLYRLTGKKFTFKTLSLFGGRAQSAVSASGGGGAPQRQATLTEGASFSSHYESESLRYEAKGLVKTADGQTISIDIGLSMSRELYTSTSTSFVQAEARSLVDPLVIDFSGAAVSLTERKFEFDLDADGRPDSISFVGEGSGFLALDKNGDGRINDGAELFGPQSGSGFGELAAYDSDRNGWIDENDEVFSRLRVWSKAADGADLLFTLREADVGAIFLGDVSTQFTLDKNGVTDGMLRSTGLFLKESGGTGLISHIDLSV
jgi:hypothetical protein